MWRFEQSTGKITNLQGTEAFGYAGHGLGKNNPLMQEAHNVGPLPCGRYKITEMILKTDSHGPYVLRLVPFIENVMFDRSGFLIHGDSIKKPGTASLGCIVLSRPVRELIWLSGDRLLEVVSGEEMVKQQIA